MLNYDMTIFMEYYHLAGFISKNGVIENDWKIPFFTEKSVQCSFRSLSYKEMSIRVDVF